MTPELTHAAKVVLEHRGDGATGWSMGWKLNQWARLQDGKDVYKRQYRNIQNSLSLFLQQFVYRCHHNRLHAVSYTHLDVYKRQ